jgi:O-antigen/teichoic acid export membrane protein
VLGATAVGLASLYPLVESWLGPGHGEAALLGGFLMFAFGVNLLTGVTTSYLRAVGRPSLEARYGLLVIGLNLLFTIPLGVAAGSVGVVAATACAYTAGTVWFFKRARRIAPVRPEASLGNVPRLVVVMLLCAAGALGWGLAMTALLPSPLALVPVALGIGVALVAFMSATTGVRPTPANARALLA